MKIGVTSGAVTFYLRPCRPALPCRFACDGDGRLASLPFPSELVSFAYNWGASCFDQHCYECSPQEGHPRLAMVRDKHMRSGRGQAMRQNLDKRT